MSRRWMLVAALGVAIVSLPEVSATASDAVVERIAAGDRYSTASAISARTFDAATVVYVASGESFADALAAAPVAAIQDAPLLLTQRDTLPAATSQELDRLKPERIVVVGGSSAVSDPVVTALRSHATTVTRVAGNDRYETGTLLTSQAFGTGGVAFVASGEAFPDAVAGGALAGRRSAPLLLVPRDSVPTSVAAELDRLQPSELVVLGGSASVSDSVLQQLDSHTAGSARRVSGADRYATSAELSKEAGTSGGTVILATGANFADALAGGVAAAVEDAPVLLVPTSCLTAAVNTEVKRLEASKVIVLGGTAAVARTVEALVECPHSSAFVVETDDSATIAELGFIYRSLTLAQDTWGDSGPIRLRVFDTVNDFNPSTPGTVFVHGIDFYTGPYRAFAQYGEWAQFESIVHEYFHTRQQWLASRGTGPLLGASGAVPVWFYEGSAAYYATLLAVTTYPSNRDFDAILATHVANSKKTSAMLCSLITYDDVYNKPDAEARNSLTVLALDHLADRFGPTGARDELWSRLASANFASGFSSTFGESVASFCSEFETYRATL